MSRSAIAVSRLACVTTSRRASAVCRSAWRCASRSRTCAASSVASVTAISSGRLPSRRLASSASAWPRAASASASAISASVRSCRATSCPVSTRSPCRTATSISSAVLTGASCTYSPST